jgi:hypothetical protein
MLKSIQAFKTFRCPTLFEVSKEQIMFNVNYILAKALQKEYLREAKQQRVSRQFQANLKKLRTAVRKGQK